MDVGCIDGTRVANEEPSGRHPLPRKMMGRATPVCVQTGVVTVAQLDQRQPYAAHRAALPELSIQRSGEAWNKPCRPKSRCCQAAAAERRKFSPCCLVRCLSSFQRSQINAPLSTAPEIACYAEARAIRLCQGLRWRQSILILIVDKKLAAPSIVVPAQGTDNLCIHPEE